MRAKERSIKCLMELNNTMELDELLRIAVVLFCLCSHRLDVPGGGSGGYGLAVAELLTLPGQGGSEHNCGGLVADKCSDVGVSAVRWLRRRDASASMFLPRIVRATTKRL